MSLSIVAKNIELTQLQLALIAMPAKKRQRILWRMADLIKKRSQSNAKGQKNLDGTPWAERKRERKSGAQKDKMFRYLPNSLTASSTPQFGTVSFKKKTKGKAKFHAGTIANQHAKGARIHKESAKHAQAMQAYEARKGLDKGNATRGQARFLVKLGCKRRGQKGKYIRATVKWIVENMSFLQAGLVISSLQGKEKHDAWDIKLPERNLLGINRSEEMKVFKRVMQGMNYGWQVKKQDMRG